MAAGDVGRRLLSHAPGGARSTAAARRRNGSTG
jgi:hypothetical protein